MTESVFEEPAALSAGAEVFVPAGGEEGVGGGVAGALAPAETEGPVTDKDGWTSVMGGDAGMYYA
jgi:hypothetical protein